MKICSLSICLVFIFGSIAGAKDFQSELFAFSYPASWKIAEIKSKVVLSPHSKYLKDELLAPFVLSVIVKKLPAKARNTKVQKSFRSLTAGLLIAHNRKLRRVRRKQNKRSKQKKRTRVKTLKISSTKVMGSDGIKVEIQIPKDPLPQVVRKDIYLAISGHKLIMVSLSYPKSNRSSKKSLTAIFKSLKLR